MQSWTCSVTELLLLVQEADMVLMLRLLRLLHIAPSPFMNGKQ